MLLLRSSKSVAVDAVLSLRDGAAMRDTCAYGHPWAENAYVIPSSRRRRCRACKRERHDPAERERIRERMHLPPPDPYRGRYALPRFEDAEEPCGAEP